VVVLLSVVNPSKDLLLHLAAPGKLRVEGASEGDKSILTELSSSMPEAMVLQPSEPAGSISEYFTQHLNSLTPSLSSVLCPTPELSGRNLAMP
jgi:hypothetical protein